MKKYILIAILFLIQTTLIFANPNITNQELSIERKKQIEHTDRQVEKIETQIKEIDKQINIIRIDIAKKLGYDLSEENLKEIENSVFGKNGKQYADEKAGRKIYFAISDELENKKDYPEYHTLKNKKDDLEDEIKMVFTNEQVEKIEKELQDTETKIKNIELNVLEKLGFESTEENLNRINNSIGGGKAYDSNEKENRKMYFALFDELRKKEDYSEYWVLLTKRVELMDKVKGEKYEEMERTASEKYDMTGIIPSYIERYKTGKIIANSKTYNKNKPSFSLFLDFGDDKFIAKNNNLYTILDDKEKQITNNINASKENNLFEIQTDIYYSAIFDKETQVIYIIQNVIAEVYEKNNSIITINLKDGKIYYFYDDLPLFPTFYLYQNQLFATGAIYNDTTIETYRIIGDKAEKYENKSDIEFVYKNQYSVEPRNYKDKDVLFLNSPDFNEKKTNTAKLIDNKTNKVYSLKCGLMYKLYYWAKTFSNALGGCEMDEPFGAFELEWEAFIYTAEEQAKIYSGCDTSDKNILTIDKFCKGIKEE